MQIIHIHGNIFQIVWAQTIQILYPRSWHDLSISRCYLPSIPSTLCPNDKDMFETNDWIIAKCLKPIIGSSHKLVTLINIWFMPIWTYFFPVWLTGMAHMKNILTSPRASVKWVVRNRIQEAQKFVQDYSLAARCTTPDKLEGLYNDPE